MERVHIKQPRRSSVGEYRRCISIKAKLITIIMAAISSDIKRVARYVAIIKIYIVIATIREALACCQERVE